MATAQFRPDANGILTARLRSWRRAKEELNGLGPKWIFRGQSDAEWTLKTSLERCVEAHRLLEMREWEDELLEQFQRAAHHYLKPGELSEPADKLEWLALMQHHGAPTRLLDFTRSPYVASFFALREAKGASAVWAIDANWCHTAARNYVDRRNSIDNGDRELIKWPNRETRRDSWGKEHILTLFDRDLALVVSLEPLRRNERLNIQRGVFLIPGDLSRPFMDMLKDILEEFGGEGLEDHVRKYELARGMQEQSIPDLNRMNINSASLFPGLDGYAESLRLYPFIYQQDIQYR